MLKFCYIHGISIADRNQVRVSSQHRKSGKSEVNEIPYQQNKERHTQEQYSSIYI